MRNAQSLTAVIARSRIAAKRQAIPILCLVIFMSVLRGCFQFGDSGVSTHAEGLQELRTIGSASLGSLSSDALLS